MHRIYPPPDMCFPPRTWSLELTLVMPGIAVSPGVTGSDPCNRYGHICRYVIDMSTSLNLKQHNNHFNGLLKFVHNTTDQLSGVLYLGFHTGGGGGANFRWPLVFTKRGAKPSFPIFFLWWNFFAKGDHGSIPPLRIRHWISWYFSFDCRKTFLSSTPAF